MVLNLSQLIKLCGTDPDSYRDHPASETQSIGLPAYELLSWFLKSHLDSFIVTGQLRSFYRDSSIWTALSGPKSSQPFTGPDSYRDMQKRMPACHRNYLRCRQTQLVQIYRDAFLPSRSLPFTQQIEARKLQDHLALSPCNHQGFRSDKKSA